MFQEPLISVIVPVYNVECYLNKCLNSIINQSYKNLEIILVNDGSSDQSLDICKEFKNKDKRVMVINQDNAGLSGARNTGLDIATGEFIGFVDSDDFIHPDMYHLLLKSLISENADMAICGIEKVLENDQPLFDSTDEPLHSLTYCCDKTQTFHHLYDERCLMTVVAWNKLYKADLFKDIRYPLNKVHEDEFVIHKIIHNILKAVYVDIKLYFYVQRNSSIMNSGFNLKRIDASEAFLNRLELFRSMNNTELASKALSAYLIIMIFHYNSIKRYFPSHHTTLVNIQMKIIEEFQNNKSYLPQNSRRKIHFFVIHPTLYQAEQKLDLLRYYLSLASNKVLHKTKSFLSFSKIKFHLH